MRFDGFHDLARLVDRDLTLVAPSAWMIDDVLLACRHSASVGDACSTATRAQLFDFIQAAPRGHDPGDPFLGRLPAYHFWMRMADPTPVPVRMAGGVSLRIGDNDNIQRYIGHVGYGVYPPARGHHLAERAVKLLLPLARLHGIELLWITCNPENLASRRTCERLGATLVEQVRIPESHPLYQRGERWKCRYKLETTV